MPFEMDGQERKKLRKALVDAFPTRGEVTMLVSDQLDTNLNTITAAANPLEQSMFDLIVWAKARGRLADLILGARRANPGNEKLFVLAQRADLTSTKERRSTLEKIVGNNTTFFDVGKWRAGLTKIEWRVCRIDYKGKGCGTGFLIGPDLVLTNFHVVEGVIGGARQPANVSCRFDYKVSAGDVISSGEPFGLADEWLVDHLPYSQHDLETDPKSGDPTDEELDFALIRLKERVGDKPPGGAEEAEARGWVPVSSDAVEFDAQKVVAILQHPQTLPLKLALGMEQQIEVNDPANRIRYTVPTEPGSSGSPVFNGDWELVALHHSGDPKDVMPAFNEAIPISKIAAREKVAAALQEIADEE